MSNKLQINIVAFSLMGFVGLITFGVMIKKLLF
jgi:hypothetical protein